MSHNIYQTECFVLGSHNTGESNKLFLLITKDLGFVMAVAQGIRDLKSKLRYSLQNFGYTKVDLVLGRDIWRITNAESINGYQQLFKDENYAIFIAHIFSTLRRLLHGEGENQELYESLTQLMCFLDKDILSKDELDNLEIVMNLKILNSLGYGTDNEIYRELILMPPSRDVLNKVKPIKRNCLIDINKSLQETHL